MTPVLDEMARLYGYAGVYVLEPDAQVVAQSSGSLGLSPSLTDICGTVARSGGNPDQFARHVMAKAGFVKRVLIFMKEDGNCFSIYSKTYGGDKEYVK